MLKNISPQSKSFTVLFALAITGTYLSVIISNNSGLKQNSYGTGYSEINYNERAGSSSPAPDAGVPDKMTEDTSGWKTYASQDLKLSFKYSPAWEIKKAEKKGDFQIIDVDPGKKFYNIKIYVSPKGYFSIAGLPTVSEQIAGTQAFNSKNMLYGLEFRGLYYTFDIGYSLSLKPDFMAMVHSVKFE